MYDLFDKRLRVIELDIKRVIGAPTFPIVNPADLPQDAINGQIAIGNDGSLNWFSNDVWSTKAGTLSIVGNVPQDILEGQIAIGSDASLQWYVNGAWYSAVITSTTGNPPQDPLEAQVALGTDGPKWFSQGSWRAFGITVSGFTLTLTLSATPTHNFLVILEDATQFISLASGICSFGSTVFVERNPTSSAIWTYDGLNTVTCSFVGLPSHQYRIQSDTGGFSFLATSDGAGNISIVLDGSIDNFGVANGQGFTAYVVESNPNGVYGTTHIGGPTTIVHSNTFIAGAASSGISDSNTLTYDGNVTVTATLSSPISGNNYRLLATQSGGGFDTVTGIAP